MNKKEKKKPSSFFLYTEIERERPFVDLALVFNFHWFSAIV